MNHGTELLLELLFEKIPILQAFSQGDPNSAPTTLTKQLNLFNT
jgi:hypothetical protein